MKLQTGLLYLDGRPATAADSAEILSEFASRHVDVSGAKIDGSSFIAYRGDRVAPEEDFERQPLTSGPCTLTWDGRLDNREEIADRAGLHHIEGVSDPDIVLAAYHLLGDSIFPDLIGEFALVLWSRIDRSLRFVRSTCGARTLYYVLSKNRLMWSSDFAHLVRVSGVDFTVNDGYVIQYLVSQPSAKESPLVNVHPVPPNRLVQFSAGRVKHTRELWDPTRISPLRHRSDFEYEEHCRSAIKNAVKVRLRAKTPIFAELSGGLDSSTIVLTADQILEDCGQSRTALQTVSCVYEESQSCDEREFIRSIEERRGVESFLIHERDQRITLGLDDPVFNGMPSSLHCFPGRYDKITEFMRGLGGRVLLTGGGGDHLFWSDPDGAPVVSDRLFELDFLGAHRECREWSRSSSVPYYEFMATRAVPLLFRNLCSQTFLGRQPEVPGWISRRHRGRLFLHTPDFEHHATWRSSPSRRAQVFSLEHMFRASGSGFFQEYDELYVSHPYSHRPLVQFCLSVPVSQFLRNGQTRSLMRRSMESVLPRKNRNRTSKGLLDETIIRTLRKEWSKTSDLAAWQICERGYVDPARLADSLSKARLGILKLTGPVFRLVSLERWLRSLSHVQRNHQSAGHVEPENGLLSPVRASFGASTKLWKTNSWWRKEDTCTSRQEWMR
jgi:asparagine synthase (glutamine-hydrolysing)